MSSKVIMGIDFGGTTIKSGLLHKGKLVVISETETNSQQGSKAIIESLITSIKKIWIEDVSAIGIGIPGFINTNTNVIELSNNIPSLKGINLCEIIKNEFKVDVRINNDANCFTLGEYHFGYHKKFNNVIGLTLGTGLGGGIIIDKKIYSGLYSSAGEFGCIPYLDKNVEFYCSNNFFKVFYNKNGNELFSEATKGNQDAISAFHKFGLHLGNLINLLIFSFAPEAFIIGGKISNAFSYIYPGIIEKLNSFPVDLLRNKIVISNATVQDPGILGAASLWL